VELRHALSSAASVLAACKAPAIAYNDECSMYDIALRRVMLRMNGMMRNKQHKKTRC
jgi:hypothetical protein